MLRVTEEKERNFEKRGYMGKKVLGIMVILEKNGIVLSAMMKRKQM